MVTVEFFDGLTCVGNTDNLDQIEELPGLDWTLQYNLSAQCCLTCSSRLPHGNYLSLSAFNLVRAGAKEPVPWFLGVQQSNLDNVTPSVSPKRVI